MEAGPGLEASCPRTLTLESRGMLQPVGTSEPQGSQQEPGFWAAQRLGAPQETWALTLSRRPRPCRGTANRKKGPAWGSSPRGTPSPRVVFIEISAGSLPLEGSGRTAS